MPDEGHDGLQTENPSESSEHVPPWIAAVSGRPGGPTPSRREAEHRWAFVALFVLLGAGIISISVWGGQGAAQIAAGVAGPIALVSVALAWRRAGK